MEKLYYTITKKDLFDLFSRLSKSHRVFVPYKNGESLSFGEFDINKEGSIELGLIRQGQPFKSFISSAREKVMGELKDDQRPVIVAGVKGCDLQGLKVQDYVFQEGDVKDPFYIKKREETVIISHDCTSAKETCFCLAMDGAPYPQSYSDINLSSMDSYFLVEVRTPKGMAIVNDYRTFFRNHSSRDIGLRDSNRQRVTEQVKGFIDKRQTPDTAKIKGTVKTSYENIKLWEDVASTCVECGACNLVCPTCHCFLLFDSKGKNSVERTRIWDACLYSTFARVAGGANPRKHLYERMRNRFDKKFDFFPETLGSFACTGCGRCIDACAGNIDLREVLKGLVTGKWNKPPHE